MICNEKGLVSATNYFHAKVNKNYNSAKVAQYDRFQYKLVDNLGCEYVSIHNCFLQC